jgi:hypothetical protein
MARYPQEIEISVWVKRGPMMVRRSALDGDDPDHPYNYIQSKYGVDPEDFGIKAPPSYRWD